jgi:hypothetical protein
VKGLVIFGLIGRAQLLVETTSAKTGRAYRLPRSPATGSWPRRPMERGLPAGDLLQHPNREVDPVLPAGASGLVSFRPTIARRGNHGQQPQRQHHSPRALRTKPPAQRPSAPSTRIIIRFGHDASESHAFERAKSDDKIRGSERRLTYPDTQWTRTMPRNGWTYAQRSDATKPK